jgi:hypothetical protein
VNTARSTAVAVVVGVGEGLGRALSRRFAEGYRVALVARTRDVTSCGRSRNASDLGEALDKPLRAARASPRNERGGGRMGASVVVIAVLVVVVGAWFVFRVKGEEETSGGGSGAAKAPSSFRCKLCGATSPTFVAAHEHASAEHELAGHHLDDSIEAQ